jgi:hypothetical protein
MVNSLTSVSGLLRQVKRNGRDVVDRFFSGLPFVCATKDVSFVA